MYLQQHAGKVEEVHVGNGCLVLQRLYELGDDGADDAGLVPVLGEGLVAVVAEVHQVLEVEGAELDGVADHLGHGLQDAAVVVDPAHPHGEHGELHHAADVGQSQVLAHGLQLARLAVLADREEGEAAEEGLEGPLVPQID